MNVPTTVEELVDNRMVLMWESEQDEMSQVTFEQDENDLIKALTSIAQTIAKATGIGAMLEKYSSLTGHQYQTDVNRVYASVGTAPVKTTVALCEKLEQSIKDAIAAANTTPTTNTPSTCHDSGVQVCDQTFITKTLDDLKKLQGDIDKLTCELQGTILKKENLANAFASCNHKLNMINDACKGMPGSCGQTPPPSCPCNR